ncbi:MAG: hypothetical protein IJU65_03615 [Desulfovibrio sp.]|nr:hypothetical protein [Desulfovibrio sp.]
MANEQNLKPCRNKREARERGLIGGKKSGEARRRKRTLRELLEVLLETKQGDMTTAEAITIALAEKALSGDVKAFETIRDTIGQKPVEKKAVEGGVTIKWDVPEEEWLK